MRARVPLWRVMMDVPLRIALDATLGVVLLPFLPWLLGGAFEHLMRSPQGLGRRAKVGLASVPMLALARVLPLVGIATVSALDEGLPYPLRVGFGALLWWVGSLAFYPLYAAPLEMLERGVGLVDGLVSSAAKSARRPLRQTLREAFGVACAGALPWFALPLIVSSPGLGFAAYLLGIFASPHLVVGLVVHAWSDGRERFGEARTPRADRPLEKPAQGPMRMRLWGAVMLALAPLAIASTILVLALLSPTAARTALPADHAVLAREALLPGAAGLRAQRGPADVLVISTSDGGGAGEVRLPCVSLNGGAASSETFSRDAYRGQSVWTYRLRQGRCENRVSFNDDGVRVDDTTYDRITQRWGGAGTWIGLAVALLAALAAFDQLRWLGRAHNLDASSSELLGTVALEGRLVGEGVAFTKGSTLHTPSGLRVDLGEHGVLTLPPEGRLTLLHPVREPATLVAGSLLSIITTLRGQQGSPFRDAQTTPPKDVRVVPGSLAQAREAYVQFASRRIALTGLFALVGAVTFAAFGLLHL